MDNRNTEVLIENYLSNATKLNKAKTGLLLKEDMKDRLAGMISTLSIEELRRLHNLYAQKNEKLIETLIRNATLAESRDDSALGIRIAACRANMDVLKILRDFRYDGSDMNKVMEGFVALDNPLLMLNEYCEFVAYNTYSGKSSQEYDKCAAVAEAMWKALNMKLLSMNPEEKNNALMELVARRDFFERQGKFCYDKAQSMKSVENENLPISDRIMINGLIGFERKHQAMMFEKYNHPYFGMVQFVDGLHMEQSTQM
jgi:hypothetical protein